VRPHSGSIYSILLCGRRIAPESAEAGSNLQRKYREYSSGCHLAVQLQVYAGVQPMVSTGSRSSCRAEEAMSVASKSLRWWQRKCRKE